MTEKKPVPVNKVNLNAPRFSKHEFVHKIVSKELYEQWKKDTGYDLSFKEFEEVWDNVAATIRCKVIDNPDGVRLPFYNGDLSTNYVEMAKRHINTVASQQSGQVINHLDWHSDGKPGKLIWAVKHARRQNRWAVLYGFAPTDDFREQVANGIKTHPEIYRFARTSHRRSVMLDAMKKKNND